MAERLGKLKLTLKWAPKAWEHKTLDEVHKLLPEAEKVNSELLRFHAELPNGEQARFFYGVVSDEGEPAGWHMSAGNGMDDDSVRLEIVRLERMASARDTGPGFNGFRKIKGWEDD